MIAMAAPSGSVFPRKRLHHRAAGPGVVLTYFIAGSRNRMGFVLAEMATVHPVAGAFGVYADL
jgi:L-asparagine transporter-like permease